MKSRLLTAAVLFLGLAGCGQNDATPVPTGLEIQLSDQFTGDFALVGEDGEPVADEDFEGKVMLVYFGFTHCPDVCPGDVGVMSAALNELGDKADEIAPIFISVDPERDTPEALSEYFDFDKRIIALTGAPEAAEAARNGFKVFAQIVPLPDSALEYTVEHQRFFFVADRQGQPRIGMIGGLSPQELAEVLRRSINEF